MRETEIHSRAGEARVGQLILCCLIWALLGGVWLSSAANADPVEVERLLLSGSGLGDTKDWEFSISAGRRAGETTTIPVPSQWEQHGFGSYNYGHDTAKSREQGEYRHRFHVPASWQGRVVDLVFEGSMTDTRARVNGVLAGPTHRGSFYRFRYDVTPLLRFGEENLLEVTVSKHSSDRSVNRAERNADYWVFGGIFRPVSLESRPPESIDHVAIDARHDGSLRLQARPRGLRAPAELHAWVERLDGERFEGSRVAQVEVDAPHVKLAMRQAGVSPWSAEDPQLYRLAVELRRGDRVLHRSHHRFGFRTVEVRPEGLWVNGHRVMLKGVNRHAFWPASGRTLNRELDRRDAELIKAMNMNAVRASHYPPDQSFLEACDELGIYVIDELAGWHDAYGSWVGRQLVREMVERDVNHPSVILWSNGNEGGWNLTLDDEFGLHDPQGRAVLHPDAIAGGFYTQHYPSWDELESWLDPGTLKNRWLSLRGALPLVMPTELLHGLYDGGSGAGLETFWSRLRASPRAAGAFLWSFTDEAIERTDRQGALDTDGNHAPDGVLGPYRELSATYYAVREVFSPVVLTASEDPATIEVENRFDATDLARCTFRWELLELPDPGEPPEVGRLDHGELPGPPTAPGERGRLALPKALGAAAADAVRWTAVDPMGREVSSWTLPQRDLRAELVAEQRSLPAQSAEGVVAEGVVTEGVVTEAVVAEQRLSLRAGDHGAVFDLESGELLTLSHRGRELSLARGPRLVGGSAPAGAQVQHEVVDEQATVDVSYRAQESAAHRLDRA
ncbi:MAG: glycoside hydrolase family 2 TIM barrel-domain containing protein, partial [Acidobacteriota bacterium]